MPKFHFQQIDLESAQKDFFSALLIWIVLAGFSFVLLPRFGLIQAEDKQAAWLLMSAPPGIVGSILVGVCSEFIRYCQERFRRRRKKLLIWLGMFIGWLGLAGIVYPLFIVGSELWLQLLNYQ